MACFVVPTVEAIVATIATRAMETKEGAPKAASLGTETTETGAEGAVPFTHKLKWLTNMLWGGSALLAFEHVWHGEVTPWFPFLTAASNPGDAAVMLHEMATVGVAMAVLVTAVWGVLVAVTGAMERKAADVQPSVD